MKNDKKIHLFLDFGNTNVKVVFYDEDTKEVVKTASISNNSLKFLFSSIKLWKSKFRVIQGLYWISTAQNNDYVAKAIRKIESQLKPSKYVDFNNFNYSKYLKLPTTVAINEIGKDILLYSAYCLNKYKQCILFNLGTVYFCIILKNKAISGVSFVPSFLKPIFLLPKIALMSEKCLPIKEKAAFGLTTDDGYVSGISDTMKGWIGQTLKKANISKDTKVIFAGQDANDFLYIKKNFVVEQDLSYKAMLYFIQLEKRW